MTGWIETHKGFVNTWECDENDHLNVQFYWKRFGDAGRIFAHLADSTPQRWTERHVRYHRELRMGARTIVRSAILPDGCGLVHEMHSGGSGALSATAVDRYDTPLSQSPYRIDSLPEQALPRSLQGDRLEIADTQPFISSGRGVVSLLSVVHPEECDQRGMMLDQHHISRFSDAAAHFWGHLGIERTWLAERGLGSVAVEMKVTRHRPVQSGMMLKIVSWLDSVGDKAFSFRHQVSDLQRGEVLYSGAVTALLIDMESRKLAPLPDLILKWR